MTTVIADVIVATLALSREGWLVRGHCSAHASIRVVLANPASSCPTARLVWTARSHSSSRMLLRLRTGPHPAVTEHHARLLQDAHPRQSKSLAEHLDRRQTINRRTRQHQRSHKFTLRSRETKPFRQSHCHLHPYFLRLPAKQLLFNYCPQMPTYEADTCMQNTASITHSITA